MIARNSSVLEITANGIASTTLKTGHAVDTVLTSRVAILLPLLFEKSVTDEAIHAAIIAASVMNLRLV